MDPALLVILGLLALTAIAVGAGGLLLFGSRYLARSGAPAFSSCLVASVWGLGACIFLSVFGPLVYWAIVMRKFRLSAGKAILACLPPMMLLGPVAAVPLAFQISEIRVGRELARRSICQANLNTIAKAIDAYRSKCGTMPDTLQTLVDAGLIDAKAIRCPAASSGRPCDYVYLP